MRLARRSCIKSSNLFTCYGSRFARFYSDQQSSTTSKERIVKQRTLSNDLKELRTRGEVGLAIDSSLLSPQEAAFFPRIKTTSLSTKRIVIHDEARHASVTLVLLAFRRYADAQVQSWRSPFLESLKSLPIPSCRRRVAQIYDVTINESFATQALSGFVQRMQRSSVDSELHDYYVVFNDQLRDPIENILPLHNRLYGYALLLDSSARVRFRAAGFADELTLISFLDAANRIAKEDAQQTE